MKIKGPIATLGAVAVLGTGLWLVNVSKQSEPAPQPAAATVTSVPAAVPAAEPAPTPAPAPSTPAAVPFGGREDFVADIPTKSGNLALEIRVTGDEARAYACDNAGIETWFSGSAANGLLKLDSADKLSHLDGRHQGNTVVGNLRIGEKSWDFTAVPGETSAF
ncbi:hypothetical protein [Mycolicibacterium stellerae]|uniref:hypothetical protein n=1 Tax=Mycolicibacterium stellerae TaxID=2358193 RepID=UPI001F3029DD|nr:hypothetical protein [Mycolicibacterium stellerae]